MDDQGVMKTLEIYICGVGVIVQDNFCHHLSTVMGYGLWVMSFYSLLSTNDILCVFNTFNIRGPSQKFYRKQLKSHS